MGICYLSQRVDEEAARSLIYCMNHIVQAEENCISAAVIEYSMRRASGVHVCTGVCACVEVCTCVCVYVHVYEYAHVEGRRQPQLSLSGIFPLF